MTLLGNAMQSPTTVIWCRTFPNRMLSVTSTQPIIVHFLMVMRSVLGCKLLWSC